MRINEKQPGWEYIAHSDMIPGRLFFRSAENPEIYSDFSELFSAAI